MTTRATAGPKNAEAMIKRRNKLVIDQAKASGLIGDMKDVRFFAWASSKLIAAAKKRAGVNSNTELLELALSHLALEDDFGTRLVHRKGSLPETLDISI